MILVPFRYEYNVLVQSFCWYVVYWSCLTLRIFAERTYNMSFGAVIAIVNYCAGIMRNFTGCF